jgi:DNA-binding CsgD family transcriptional regulator
LFLAVSTVRSYIKTIYRKLDVHDRDEAITRGQQLGVI